MKWKCEKCSTVQDEPCFLSTKAPADPPFWCPFGLYPGEGDEDDMQANWKPVGKEKVDRRKMKGECMSKYMCDVVGKQPASEEKMQSIVEEGITSERLETFISERGNLPINVKEYIKSLGYVWSDSGGGRSSWNLGVPFEDFFEAVTFFNKMQTAFEAAIQANLLSIKLMTWSAHKLPINNPILSYAKCANCAYAWKAFFPDGIEKIHKIECPKCGESKGYIVDEGQQDGI